MVGIVSGLKAPVPGERGDEIMVGRITLRFLGERTVRVCVSGCIGRGRADQYLIWGTDDLDAAMMRAADRLKRGGYAAADEVEALKAVAELWSHG